MVGHNLIQFGPGGVSTAQVAFHVLLAEPLDDRLPTNAPHIHVYECDITSGASSKGCVLTTLLTTPGRFLSVNEAPRSRLTNILVGDNPGDLLATGVKKTLYTLIDSGENYIGREDELVSLPERRSGRELRRRTRIGESRGRCEIPLSPWWHVWGSTTAPRGGVLRFRFLFSTNSFLDQAVDDLDGLSADFDRFPTNRVGLGQSRPCLRIADHNPSTRKRRARGGRTRSRS